jgi:hypothetical protein
MFEKRVLRKIRGLKRDKVQGSGEDYITRSFMICAPNQILFGQDEWDGQVVLHVWETAEIHTGLWFGDLRKRDHLENLGIDGENVKMDLQ